MIIDIHNHPYWYGYDEKKFVENMDENGIDVTVLLTWQSPADEYDPAYNKVLPEVGAANGPVSFESVLKMYRSAPNRFLMGYCPDPRKEESTDKLLYAKNTYGIKICGEHKYRLVFDNPDAVRMFRVCGKENLPVLLHLDDPWDNGKKYPRPDYWYGGGIDALERVLRKCPDTAFIGHAPGFWSYISGEKEEYIRPYQDGKVKAGGKVSELLDKYPNLYCDISAGSGYKALSRDKEFTAEFLDKYQDRVCYGRDYFDDVHRKLLDGLELSKSTLDKIYCKNAAKLMGLDLCRNVAGAQNAKK